MMNHRWFIFALAALSLLACACRRERMPVRVEDESVLNLSINIRGMVSTKAEEGVFAASAAESKINSLQIWVFLASNVSAAFPAGYLVGYAEPDLDTYNFSSGSPVRLSMALDPTIAKADPRPSVTVYAIVNGESAGLTLSALGRSAWTDVTVSDLEGLYLDGNLFGTGTLTTEVPASGLPLAGKKTATLGGSFPILEIETVELTRLVSRVRFVFCQVSDNGVPGEDFTITGISLGGQIGAKEKVFTTNEYTPYAGRMPTNIFDIDGYGDLSMNVTSAADLPSSVALNTAPTSYFFSNFSSAQDYENHLDAGVSSGVLTEWRRIYLRETDKALSGQLKYRVNGGEEKTWSFSLDAGDFTRNHSWVIYAYFLGGKLYVKPVAMPWIAGHDYYEYNTQGQTVMDSGISYLRYDLDGIDWTWFDGGEPETWMCISYSPHGARPLYSALEPISIHTNNEYTLVLQSNNPHFLLQEVEYSGNTVSGYKTPETSITLPPGENDLSFYIVAAAATLGGRSAYGKIFLTATPDPATGIPPYNVPFNHLLPGPEGHTAILVYDPLPTTYIANMDNKYVEESDPAARMHYWWVGDK